MVFGHIFQMSTARIYFFNSDVLGPNRKKYMIYLRTCKVKASNVSGIFPYFDAGYRRLVPIFDYDDHRSGKGSNVVNMLRNTVSHIDLAMRFIELHKRFFHTIWVTLDGSDQF